MALGVSTISTFAAWAWPAAGSISLPSRSIQPSASANERSSPRSARSFSTRFARKSGRLATRLVTSLARSQAISPIAETSTRMTAMTPTARGIRARPSHSTNGFSMNATSAASASGRRKSFAKYKAATTTATAATVAMPELPSARVMLNHGADDVP